MDAKRTRSKPTAPPKISADQLAHEVKTLKNQIDRLQFLVNKHNDILQVQDNWHSRVKDWIGKEVQIQLSRAAYVTGKLLYTDRYTLGLQIDGKDYIINKGHIVSLRRED